MRSKRKQHFILHLCLKSIFENIKCKETKSKKVLERIKKRTLFIREFSLTKPMTEKELRCIERQMEKMAKLYSDFLIYEDVLIFHKALMIAVDVISSDIPKTAKYKEFYDNYRRLSSSAMTFFLHLDDAAEKKNKPWSEFRKNKAEMLSKKMVKIIRGEV